MAGNGQNTQVKRERGRFVPGHSGAPDKVFSKDNQPPGENKSKGRRLKQEARQQLKELLEMKYKFRIDSPVKHQLIEAFGDQVLKMSSLQIANLQQIQKAILKGDTEAWAKLWAQVYGPPKQSIELTGIDDSQLFENKSNEELLQTLQAVLSKVNA